jgi:hypothetical protein
MQRKYPQMTRIKGIKKEKIKNGDPRITQIMGILEKE